MLSSPRCAKPPAVALLGSRQVGKTTLAEQVARRRGFEFKCTDAPRLTKSMQVVSDDLGLSHLWVVYPGDLQYPLAPGITALPLKEVGAVALEVAA